MKTVVINTSVGVFDAQPPMPRPPDDRNKPGRDSKVTNHNLLPLDRIDLTCNLGEYTEVVFRVHIDSVGGNVVHLNVYNNMQEFIDRVIAMTQQGLLHNINIQPVKGGYRPIIRKSADVAQ